MIAQPCQDELSITEKKQCALEEWNFEETGTQIMLVAIVIAKQMLDILGIFLFCGFLGLMADSFICDRVIANWWPLTMPCVADTWPQRSETSYPIFPLPSYIGKPKWLAAFWVHTRVHISPSCQSCNVHRGVQFMEFFT